MARALSFIAFLWLVFFINVIIPIDLNELGMSPRSVKGLLGIVTMPFLHGNLPHIISNSIGLFIMLIMLNASHTEESAAEKIISIILASGVLLWIFGRGTTTGITVTGELVPVAVNHIGASALLYGLVTYLTWTAIMKKDAGLMTACVVMLMLDGGSYISGMIPQSGISWDGHIAGAVGGLMVAKISHLPEIAP